MGLLIYLLIGFYFWYKIYSKNEEPRIRHWLFKMIMWEYFWPILLLIGPKYYYNNTKSE